jgi:hypothetical protein
MRSPFSKGHDPAETSYGQWAPRFVDLIEKARGIAAQ